MSLGMLRNIKCTARAAVAALVLSAVVGCTSQTPQQAVQSIANVIPVVQADINLAASIAVTIDPSAVPMIQSTVSTAQTALVELRSLCNSYVSAPSPTTLGKINDVLNTLLNTSAQSLLDAAKITNPSSRDQATRILAAIQTSLLLAYSFYQQVQTKAQKTQTASMRTYKLRDVSPYIDHDAVARASGHSYSTTLAYAEAQGF